MTLLKDRDGTQSRNSGNSLIWIFKSQIPTCSFISAKRQKNALPTELSGLHSCKVDNVMKCVCVCICLCVVERVKHNFTPCHFQSPKECLCQVSCQLVQNYGCQRDTYTHTHTDSPSFITQTSLACHFVPLEASPVRLLFCFAPSGFTLASCLF